MGEVEWVGILLSAQALTMVRLAWVKLLPFSVPQLQAEKALILNEGEYVGTEWCTGWCSEHKVLQLIAMLQIPGLGSHGKGVHHSSQNIKPGWGDPRECIQTPSSNYQ